MCVTLMNKQRSSVTFGKRLLSYQGYGKKGISIREGNEGFQEIGWDGSPCGHVVTSTE